MFWGIVPRVAGAGGKGELNWCSGDPFLCPEWQESSILHVSLNLSYVSGMVRSITAWFRRRAKKGSNLYIKAIIFMIQRSDSSGHRSVNLTQQVR